MDPNQARRDFDFVREWRLKMTKGRDPACRSEDMLANVGRIVQVTVVSDPDSFNPDSDMLSNLYTDPGSGNTDAGM